MLNCEQLNYMKSSALKRQFAHSGMPFLQIAPLILLFAGIVGLSSCAGVTASPSGNGSSAAAVTISPPSISFGSVAVGSTVSQTIIASNNGSASVTFQASISGQAFSLSGISGSASIAAGQQATFTVAFMPTSAGAATGSIIVSSAALSSPISIALSGTGVSSNPQLSANPASVNFGNVVVNTTGVQNVTVTNSGNANVTISNISVSGAGYTATGISSNLVLTPNQSATLTVNFDPTSASGTITGSVSIASNATGSPLQIGVSGNAVAASSHTVSLNWQPSTSSGVVGYYIYRGTTSGGPYAKLNPSAPSTSDSYTDQSVASGQTYYYVVTATDSSQDESAYSNQASAAVPNP